MIPQSLATSLAASLVTSDRTWHVRYLDLAHNIASWSKDPSRHIGAVIVRDRRILATGYNGFPRGITDLASRWESKDEKYKYVVHGEMNAIYNAIAHGLPLTGATLYVTGLPVCGECAKGIIQVGIMKVVVPEEMKKGIHSLPVPWAESCERACALFHEAGVVYEGVSHTL